MNGGTSLSLLFPKVITLRWYSAHSGVVLRSLLGLLASILEVYEFLRGYLYAKVNDDCLEEEMGGF